MTSTPTMETWEWEDMAVMEALEGDMAAWVTTEALEAVTVVLVVAMAMVALERDTVAMVALEAAMVALGRNTVAMVALERATVAATMATVARTRATGVL